MSRHPSRTPRRTVPLIATGVVVLAAVGAVVTGLTPDSWSGWTRAMGAR